MASRVLYPPIVDSYMPAFQAGSGSCRLYFSLSKFNSSTDFSSVHVSVVKQDTGMNVVKKVDSNNKYRATGIILNVKPIPDISKDNLFYIEINNDDLSSISGSYSGWIPGWIYKIQIRLSSVDYDNSVPQAAWLNNNASFFSEWSTVCTVKATGQIYYSIPILDINTEQTIINTNSNNTLYISTLDLSGHFTRKEDPSEVINYCQFILYDSDDNVLDNSGYIYMNQYQDNDSFNYTAKVELINNATYKLAFKYETKNHYIDGFYKFDDETDDRYVFDVSLIATERINCTILTAENDSLELLTELTSIDNEEDEGRLGLKLYSSDLNPYSGNVCIRRADSRDNFKTWTDIKILVFKDEVINEADIIYDYTIESGVWYKYGVQSIDKNGNRGILNQMPNPAIRNFNYSFLLGKNNQQLKLMFDNSMNSFKYQISESKVDSIGGRYPIVTRNAATLYRVFPINGLISFWMDENKLFCDKRVIYKYEDIVDLYEKYNNKNSILQYDYIYEKDFRQKVLDFLYDGELKIFKSPTEGNIIVRLTDINCTPVQSLDRMLYSFNCTANEMMESNMENYFSNGFYEVGNYASDFATYTTYLGQLQMDFPVGTNVFQEIYKKYDSQGKNFAGYSKTVKNIHHIKITFDDKPLRVLNSNNEVVVGNNFYINNKLITSYALQRQYEFDERLSYTPNDSLILLGDAEGKVATVRATIDFLYELQSDVYQEKQIQSQTIKSGIGQIYSNYKPDSNLFNEIYYKYFIEWGYQFQRLGEITSIEIEANPRVLIGIKDNADVNYEIHEINETGQLRFEDLSSIAGLKYIGIRAVDGSIDTSKDANILINYKYSLISGVYKEI